jgi:hypothetical protein
MINLNRFLSPFTSRVAGNVNLYTLIIPGNVKGSWVFVVWQYEALLHNDILIIGILLLPFLILLFLSCKECPFELLSF